MTHSATLAAAVVIGTLSFSSNVFAQENRSDAVALNQNRSNMFTEVSSELREVIAQIRAELLETKAKVIELWSSSEDDQVARLQARQQIRALQQQARAVRAEARAEILGEQSPPEKQRALPRGLMNQGQGQQIRHGQETDNGRRIRGANAQTQNGQGQDNGRRIRGANTQTQNGQGQDNGRRIRGTNAQGAGNGQGAGRKRNIRNLLPRPLGNGQGGHR